ncbi:hypothetical protein J6590_030446 [Homalodisca vitripennis]|nr:hypothetical protein J6590_030446 [Homalodisca vitripennis]
MKSFERKGFIIKGYSDLVLDALGIPFGPLITLPHKNQGIVLMKLDRVKVLTILQPYPANSRAGHQLFFRWPEEKTSRNKYGCQISVESVVKVLSPMSHSSDYPRDEPNIVVFGATFRYTTFARQYQPTPRGRSTTQWTVSSLLYPRIQ